MSTGLGPWVYPDFEIIELSVEPCAPCDIVDHGKECPNPPTCLARSRQAGYGAWVCRQHADMMAAKLGIEIKKEE